MNKDKTDASELIDYGALQKDIAERKEECR